MNIFKGLQAYSQLGKLIVLYVLISLFTSGCMSSSSEPFVPKAENGVIDLRGWSSATDGIVPLNGHWSFTWVQPKGNSSSTLEVPGIWNKLRMGNGQPLEYKGIGIYELRIKHHPQADPMAIQLSNIPTAYQLYINGTLTATRGNIDLFEHHITPYQLPALVHYQALGEETELKLIVGNEDHRSGGIRSEIMYGSADQLHKHQVGIAARELIILGCLIMIIFYHLGLYILRRKELANLFFALLCLFVCIRMGSLGESFILQWLPWINWEMAIRMEYMALIMSGWCGYCYYRTLYPREGHFKLLHLLSVLGILLILSLFIFPSTIFTSGVIVYQLYVLLLGALILAGLVLASLRKREGARLALIGMAGIVFTIINDVLLYNGWWNSIDLVPYGLLFLIVMNSFIISQKFSLTYEHAEQMSAELAQWNQTLEDKIIERTEELQQSYATLEEAKLELEKLENARIQLVSNISHDIRTPITLLQGYLEALRDKVITDPEKMDATIRLMHTKVEGLNSLFRDLLDLSVLESRKVELSKEQIPLREWQERLINQYALEMQQKNIRFECILVPTDVEDTRVSMDILRMDRVFANLIYNAVRYTPDGGKITVTIRALIEKEEVVITVTDCGIGIHSDDLPFIFDRYYQKGKQKHTASGFSGLGLSIAKEIVELHGGRIRAENSPEGGCVIEVKLPSLI